MMVHLLASKIFVSAMVSLLVLRIILVHTILDIVFCLWHPHYTQVVCYMYFVSRVSLQVLIESVQEQALSLCKCPLSLASALEFIPLVVGRRLEGQTEEGKTALLKPNTSQGQWSLKMGPIFEQNLQLYVNKYGCMFIYIQTEVAEYRPFAFSLVCRVLQATFLWPLLPQQR